MHVKVLRCGAIVNESEETAINQLERELQNIGGSDEWILLTNLSFSVNRQVQSDEIDIIAIGPPGVRVIEVKHWSNAWVDQNKNLVEREADKVSNKARKIGTTLRRIVANLPHVSAGFLLTRQPSKVKKIVETGFVRGVSIHSLNQWKDAIGFDAQRALAQDQIRLMAQFLDPKVSVKLDGSLRRLAGYINLELKTPKDERFHRVYSGVHPARRDRVILHLYDLSAKDDESKAKEMARREAEVLRRLQYHSWAPRILDSFQDAPGYAGEMFFFTVVDPAAPTLEDRASDEDWNSEDRLKFAKKAVHALQEFHETGGTDQPIIHRNITTKTILVRYDNSPIITGFDRVRIPDEISVASSVPYDCEDTKTFAPEILERGFSAADRRSDVYSLCTCLIELFEGRPDDLSISVCEILQSGRITVREKRNDLADIEKKLSELLGESKEPPPAPSARFWTEDQVVRFHNRDYRIITHLGNGGVGTAFKVVELDRSTREELGTYVAKISRDADIGRRVLKAYSLARSHLGRNEALSPIFEVAHDWKENSFISLLGWVNGTPLREFIGVFSLLADDLDESSPEALAIHWVQDMCDALDVLHRNGLTHGDISPSNIIVSGNNLVLTDYDFVSKIGDSIDYPGTLNYCSPEREKKAPSSKIDDFYALAASFFHVLFDKDPFLADGHLDKSLGLKWEGVDREPFPIISKVLDRATHVDPSLRYDSAEQVRNDLRKIRCDRDDVLVVNPAEIAASNCIEDELINDTNRRPSNDEEVDLTTKSELSEQSVDWLKSLLQSYPGSRWGNRETRGLDTEFASDTYVPTALEESLLSDIREKRVRLVILCGNAGDGKTALLQHLALKLGIGRHQSSNRIFKGGVPNGPRVHMNLDGSASWNGKSADEILDEFLAPFQDGPPDDDIVHLLAVNDGRLLEWIDGVEQRIGRETALTGELYRLLQRESESQASHIKFVCLNERSLVGAITSDFSKIETTFLERLLDHLYGGDRAADIWSPCRICSAKDRCRVFEAARIFGPEAIDSSTPREVRNRARGRLFEALQAVHLRGEIHITVRELRAALVYILFGIHFCKEYHDGSDKPLPYWDRAFAADSPARQGEVLRELSRFDPALESHPQIDRYLLSRPSIDNSRTTPRYDDLALESARRRAFFEWTSDEIEKIAGDPESLDLSRGRHIKLFRELPLRHDSQKVKEIALRLCAGISRLEDLPPQALDKDGVVPLRIKQRTPTDTAFWVQKPLANFRIEVNLPPETEGIERLHRQVSLIYRYRDGKEERLRLGAELFHLLMELADGYQLGDVSTDDTFAHLSIFVQRLVQEDEHELMAWSPTQDEQLYKLSAVIRETPKGPSQRLEITQIPAEAK
jgi:serine/threonine protein kinase